MSHRLVTRTALVATLVAAAFVAAPASAQTVGFGLSLNVPGLSMAVGTPAYGGPGYGAAVYGGPAYGAAAVAAPVVVAPRAAYGYGPYRPYYKRWYRPYAPAVYRPPVIAYPAPVVVRPRPVVYAVPYLRPVAAPYYGAY